MAREIKLTEVEIEKNGNKEEFNYLKNIERILDTTPQGGFSLPDVRISNKIQKVIDTSNGSLILEEQQYKFLKKKLEAFRWGAPHQAIEDFADTILNAPQVDPDPKK